MSAVSMGSVSFVNNGFDLVATLGDVFSPQGAKSIALAGATAGATFGIADKFGVPHQLSPTMSDTEKLTTMAANSGIRAGARMGLAPISNEKLESILKTELAGLGLGAAQLKVGDIAQSAGIQDGSPIKAAMHGAVGAGVAGATGSAPASGLLGGVMSEIVPGMMSSGSGNTSPPSAGAVKALTQISTAVAGLATGGNERQINTAVNTANSAIEHNYLAHFARVFKIIKQSRKATKPPKAPTPTENTKTNLSKPKHKVSTENTQPDTAQKTEWNVRKGQEYK